MAGIPRPAQNLVIEEVGDEICLFRPDIDEVLVLNATASDVWRLLDGSSDVDAVAGHLARVYSADPAKVLDGVRAVVDDLSARGFVVDGAA